MIRTNPWLYDWRLHVVGGLLMLMIGGSLFFRDVPQYVELPFWSYLVIGHWLSPLGSGNFGKQSHRTHPTMTLNRIRRWWHDRKLDMALNTMWLTITIMGLAMADAIWPAKTWLWGLIIGAGVGGSAVMLIGLAVTELNLISYGESHTDDT